MTARGFVALAETTRSGRVESTHFGAMVALGRDGAPALSAGDPELVIYPRSSNKPMQAVAMLRCGLSLPPDLLAVVCASHDGSPLHIDAVRRVLATAGLDETALQNTPDLPLDETSAHDVLLAGGTRTPLQQNCSGKHSGMLATCVVNGWPLETYLDPSHPLQKAIDATLPSLTGEPIGHIGVDGCGAPAHMMSLLGLARAFRRMAMADGGAEAAVCVAMTGRPDLVGGPARDVTQLMRHVPGLLAKDGAEGVFALALADGRAVAVKIADGNKRAYPPVLIAALGILGVDVAAVAPLLQRAILGHGHEVGSVTAIVDALITR